MTSNNCAIFKIFLKTDTTTEVRKFVVDDASVITSFIFMKEKLQTLFPILRKSYFKITWRDSEGDDIIIDCDEDLILAFTEMEGPLKTLYVTISSCTREEQEQGFQRHSDTTPNVVCDVCNNAITAYRYKCLQCFDYDLCGSCEQAGHHSHHMMLRSSTPDLPFQRCGRKVFEHVNKAFKKANHMAYRDYKKKSRWDKCDKKNRTDGCENNATGEGSSKQDPEASGCPFEMYVPQFYPLIDAISNAAGAAANAAASAATNAAASANPSAQPTAANPTFSSQQPSSEPKQTDNTNDENNATTQFVEMIRNVLSGVFVQPPQSHPTTQGTNTQTHTANATENQAPVPNAPVEIDLTGNVTEPSLEPMETSSQLGWTVLTGEEPVPQSHYPVLTPIQVSPPVPQDPKIAMGLSQLLDMGFSDEQALIALLKRYNGNVDEVIKHIFERR